MLLAEQKLHFFASISGAERRFVATVFFHDLYGDNLDQYFGGYAKISR